MYCPECGTDAGDAKFCPECGANLAGVKDALQGGAGGRQGGKTTGRLAGKAGRPGAPAKPGEPAPPPSEPARSGISPGLLWGIVAVVALLVVGLVVAVPMITGGSSSSSTSDQGSSAPVQPVAVNTSGSYSELVAEANKLYDQGDKAFQSQEFDQGSAYFQGAAKAYAVAWKKQPGDPNVGTDFATALFYSGDIEGALKQVDVVLAKSPGFQTAWFNKGNFLAHKARIADQQGEKAVSKKAYAAAKVAYAKAVAIDPSSAIGKQADQSLQILPR